MKKLINYLKQNWPLFVVIIIQIPLFWPFFHQGFFPSHDNVQVVRVFEIFQSLKYGDIPPRWSANLLYGYGYPLYIFYGPLPYLIGAFFVLFLNNYLLATKAVFILSFIIGPLGVYLLAKDWWGKIPALLAAVAFSLAPYRAVDVYVRGNLGEFFSFSFFPLVFWVNWRYLTKKNDKKHIWWLIFVLSLFLLEISHNISCFIFLLFLGIFNLYFLFFESPKENRRKTAGFLLKAVGFSLILSSFYLIPLAFEAKYVLVGQFRDSPYWEYFLTFRKLWYSPWGWGSYIDKNDAMSLQLGKTLIIFSLFSVLLNFFKKNRNKKIFFLTGCLAVFSFMELKASNFIWNKISLLHYFQFPWRFHILLTLFLALLCGGLIFSLESILKIKQKKTITIFLTIFFSFLFYNESLRFFKPRIFSDAPAVSETTTWNDEYLPKWVNIKPKDYTGTKAKIIQGEGTIKKEVWGYLKKEFTVVAEEESVLQIAHVYYPGWTVFVNGKKEQIMYQNDYGQMRVNLPKGTNQVSFIFKRTSWRMVAEIISSLGIVVILYLFTKEILKLKK